MFLFFEYASGMKINIAKTKPNSADVTIGQMRLTFFSDIILKNSLGGAIGLDITLF